MPHTKYTEFQKLTHKDIELLLINVSPATAKQYLTDIKKEFQTPIVLFNHFKQYFKITVLP